VVSWKCTDVSWGKCKWLTGLQNYCTLVGVTCLPEEDLSCVNFESLFDYDDILHRILSIIQG